MNLSPVQTHLAQWHCFWALDRPNWLIRTQIYSPKPLSGQPSQSPTFTGLRPTPDVGPDRAQFYQEALGLQKLVSDASGYHTLLDSDSGPIIFIGFMPESMTDGPLRLFPKLSLIEWACKPIGAHLIAVLYDVWLFKSLDHPGLEKHFWHSSN